jgi:hypothetical protein
VDSSGRTIWIADAHGGDGKRFLGEPLKWRFRQQKCSPPKAVHPLPFSLHLRRVLCQILGFVVDSTFASLSLRKSGPIVLSRDSLNCFAAACRAFVLIAADARH